MQSPFSNTVKDSWIPLVPCLRGPDMLLYPNCVALGSFILLLGHIIYERFQSRRELPVGAHAGGGFKAIRFAGCIVLTCLAAMQWFSMDNLSQITYCTLEQFTSILTFLYASILSGMSLKSTSWSPVFVRHVNLVLGAELAVFTYRDVFPLATFTKVPMDLDQGSLIWVKIGLLFVTAVMAPLLAPRVYVPLDPMDPITPNTEQTSSIFSAYLFLFLNGVVYSAREAKGKFSYDELPTLADYSHARNLKKKSFPYLDEFYGAKRTPIWFGLLKTFRYRPWGVNRLLTYLENPTEALIRPWVWILVLFLGPSVASVVNSAYTSTMYNVMVEAEAIIVSLVFEHALRIRLKAEIPNAKASSNASSSGGSTPESGITGVNIPVNSSNLIGKINNLITTDAIGVAKAKDPLNFIVYAPLSFAFGTFLLYSILGWSAFVGLGFMVALTPVPGMFAKLSRSAQVQKLEKTDARVQKVTETMNVLRMVKLFGWEILAANQLNEKRREELFWVKRLQLLNVMSAITGKILPAVTMLTTFVVYKRDLTPAVVFSSIAVFQSVGSKIGVFLFYLNNTVTGKVSLDRIDTFLHETELLDDFTAQAYIVQDDPARGIGFHNAIFTWAADQSARQFILRIDDLIFRPGVINIITGPTGSGKTSILFALLGELHFVPTDSDSWFNLPRGDGNVAYVDQTPWVLNDTIRENILFGLPMHEERYKKVLYQCALEPDIALFEAGDNCEVGERGLTLSGGQRARVSLARAIYSDATILLLDDVMAALDVHTSLWIIRKCLSGDLVVNRTVILVTHNLDIAMPIASYCVNVRNGTIWDQGPVTEVVTGDKDLSTTTEIPEKVEEQDVIKELSTQEAGKLIIEEEVAIGNVSWKSCKPYFVALIGKHTILVPVIYAFCLIGADIMVTSQKYYLGFWSSLYEDHDPSEVSVPYHLGVYTLSLSSLDSVLFMFSSIRASTVIHKNLIVSVMRTTFRWLDSTPVSRIITRCTTDIATLDGMLPAMLKDLIHISSLMFIEMCSIVLVTPQFLFVGAVVGALGYLWGQTYYMPAQLGIKRQVSNAKAPILAHLGAAIAGLVSVRAYGVQEAFIRGAESRIDKYSRAVRPYENLICWIATRLEILGGCFEAALAAYIVYFSRSGASDTGFSLAQASAFSSQIMWWVWSANSFELSANSLERIEAYVDAEKEPASTDSEPLPAYWPASGDLRVEKLSAKYSFDGPKVLEDISFEIKSGQRVGIVGRTGSGKSSLALSLLRCICTEGTVYLDGIPTTKISLEAVRTAMTIIPQTPELLNGSLRYNLDPFELYDDQTLSAALGSAGLFSLQAESGSEENHITLDSNIAAGGGNLSVGQRQIIALARALVRRSKILILDEATSAIDYRTDAVIQHSLRTEVKSDMTLITIAHRLQTIMDVDKILVLDGGHLAEFGTPKELLAKEGGMLRSLVDESADREILIQMVKKGAGRMTSGT
ncbi:multidrug resistance-associated ABC transporter [Mycena floridula]|nr:multidrug resistance-associated ABC transporter [Mycena floridula]